MSHTNKQEQLALMLAYRLLSALADPKKLAAVPEHVREQAKVVLRHYPVPAKLDALYQNISKAP